jgi:hypothetical protein
MPLLAALLAFAAVADDNAESKYACKLTKKDDACKIAADKEGVVFRVRSGSGIGGATLTGDDGKWPARVAVQLADFKALEQVTASDGRVKLEGFLKRGDAKTTWKFDKAGKPIEGDAVAAYTLTVEQQKGQIEVTLAAPDGVKAWDVRWVNEFR